MPLLVGTSQGHAYVVYPSGLGGRVFDCGDRTIWKIERSPDARTLFVSCSDRTGDADGYLWRPGSDPVRIPFTIVGQSGTWSPDGRTLALLVPGQCTPTAPVCERRIVTYDIASRATRTIHDGDVLISNLRWTPRGLTYFRGGTPEGTLLRVSDSWTKVAADPIVAAAGQQLLLDRAVYGAGGERHVAVLLDGTTESILTSASDSERAVAIAGDRVIGLREDAPGATSIIVYERGVRASVVSGEFGTVAVQWGGWLASLTHHNTVAFYSLDARRFAPQTAPLGESAAVLAIGIE